MQNFVSENFTGSAKCNASSEANWSRNALFDIQYVNLYQ